MVGIVGTQIEIKKHHDNYFSRLRYATFCGDQRGMVGVDGTQVEIRKIDKNFCCDVGWAILLWPINFQRGMIVEKLSARYSMIVLIAMYVGVIFGLTKRI